MQTLKTVVAIIVVVFTLLSLLPYGERTNPKSDPSLAIDAPKDVMKILQKSCYDCHSNQTKWPWYSYVFPLAWSIKDHVKNGRASLNFDEWKRYSKEKQQKLLYSIAQKTGTTMPLKQYLWFHKDAKLSKAEVERIRKWANASGEVLLDNLR